jgi:hypothetical protein
MKKQEIYVVIDSEEKRLRAIQILSDAQEEIWEESLLFIKSEMGCLICRRDNLWYLLKTRSYKEEISLDQLDRILNTKEIPSEDKQIPLDALKLIAESYGFELVEKPREIKVGDFGKFWDNDNKDCCFGFLHTIDNDLGSFDLGSFESGAGLYWSKFHHLTDEEKQQIQENW